MKLMKLGFTSNIETLDVFRAEAFCLISNEIDRLNREEVKKQKAKAKAKSKTRRR